MGTDVQAWTMALQHYQVGDLAGAEACCRQVLKADPSHADALHLFGVIAVQLGKHDIGIEFMRRAIEKGSENAVFHYDLALAYHVHGHLDSAVQSYRESLRLKPNQPEVLNNLGCALADLGQNDEAVAAYQQALGLPTPDAGLHYNFGNALAKLGKWEDAADQYRQALLLNPEYVEAHDNLGNVRIAQGKPDAALPHYQQALNIDPQYARARNNLGNAFHKLGRLNEAVACYRTAITLQPGVAEVHFNLGRVLMDQGKLVEAIHELLQAVQLRPDFADAHAALGGILSDQGRSDEPALAIVSNALANQPNDQLKIALATCLPAVCQSVAELALWRNRLVNNLQQFHDQRFTVDVTAQTAPNVFYLAYQGGDDREIQRSLGKIYRAPETPRPQARTAGKIRVGFVSSHFKTHTIGHFMRGLIAQLSRQDFDVTVLSIGSHHDALADFIRQKADHFVQLPRHLPSARQRIAEQHLDILVYTDIGLEAMSHTLAFSRLAPVQCVLWGHPITTGIPAIDYFLSADDLETEDADSHYTETLIRLKTLPIYYYQPDAPTPRRERGYFGLTTADHVYACAHSLFKFHPEFDELLGGILRADPQGKLVLSQGPFELWHQQLRQRFAATLPDVMDRIVFLPEMGTSDFLHLLTLSDVQLDTLHFGGGRASYDALAMGTPIVTLPSRYLRGRYTLALYKQMGVMDCVTDSPTAYIDVALRLGMDAAYRASIHAKILAANSAIFENPEGVKELEKFFRDVTQRSK